MVCARVRAIMHSLTLVHYRYVHVHNHGISKTYHLFCPKKIFLIKLYVDKVSKFYCPCFIFRFHLSIFLPVKYERGCMYRNKYGMFVVMHQIKSCNKKVNHMCYKSSYFQFIRQVVYASGQILILPHCKSSYSTLYSKLCVHIFSLYGKLCVNIFSLYGSCVFIFSVYTASCVFLFSVYTASCVFIYDELCVHIFSLYGKLCVHI